MKSLIEYNLLGPDILISHFNNARPETSSALVSCGGHISATPSTELQMTHGYPMCFREDLAPISSLGVDCHSATSASLVSEMRLGLQHARSVHNQSFNDKGSIAPKVNIPVTEVFNLATIKGARAARMEDLVGSISEGKLADLVLFDKMSPGMVAAAEHDPVAAIVAHSSVRDVEVVIIDGVVRKETGKLSPIHSRGKQIAWADVSKELVSQRTGMQKKADSIDYEQVTREFLASMGFA